MSAADASRRALAGVPVTASVLVVTAAVSVAAALDPALTRLLTRDTGLVGAGEWWRLVTPILVQPDGWGQLVFNLLGVAVVGVALERRRGPTLWLVAYLVAGIGSILLLSLLRPGDHGGGSSDCVAGLTGAVALGDVRGGRAASGVAAAVATAYAAFFCAYLCALDVAGPWVAMVVGDVAVAVVLPVRRRDLRGAAVVLLALVVVTGVVMAARADGHGIGLLVGVLVTLAAQLANEYHSH